MTNVIHAEPRFAERRAKAEDVQWARRKARLCPARADELIHRHLGSDD